MPRLRQEEGEDCVKEHVCHIGTSCCCYTLALEPNEDCPLHGYPELRCEECGRFMPQQKDETKVGEEPTP